MIRFILQAKVETRTGGVRKVYYGGMNGATGRAFFAPTKSAAPAFDAELSAKILSQLEKLDNKGWIAVEA